MPRWTPGLTSGEHEAPFLNRLTLKPQLTNFLTHFMAAVDGFLIALLGLYGLTHFAMWAIGNYRKKNNPSKDRKEK
jgi:hypothetical protein